MNFILLFLVLKFSLIYSRKERSRDLRETVRPCGFFTCWLSGSVCEGEGISQICVCFITHATFPEDSPVMCNYEKYLQKTAFIYETLFTIGIGHIYAGRNSFGIAKMIIFTIGYLLICLIRFNSKDTEEYDVGIINLSAISSVFLITMIIWHIIDIYYFGFNKYMDGNGIMLVPWNANTTYVSDLTLYK